MITVLVGENNFEVRRRLEAIVAGFGGQVERIDGSELDLKNLPDILMGQSLFADQRLVIVKGLSENTAVWSRLGDWIGRVSMDIHLVLVEVKPDKRTKTYKDLQKHADLHEFKPWTERDISQAEKWVIEEAERLGSGLDTKCARLIVQRVGTDQWQLYHALEKLAVLEKITPEIIMDIIDATPVENVFSIFEAALKGDGPKVKKMLGTFETTEEPYKLFGLLANQAMLLAALSVTDKPPAQIATDLGAHPFVLSKLAPHAKRLGKAKAKKVVAALREADSSMKTSAHEPWLLLERALMKIVCL